MADMTEEEIESMKRELLAANEEILALLATEVDDNVDEVEVGGKIWETPGGRQVIFWVIGAILLGALAFTGGLNAEAIGTILTP